MPLLLLAVLLVLSLLDDSILATPVSSKSGPRSHCEAEHRKLTNLWRVNTSPPSYLFGTIHVPYSLVWEGIANNSKTAFFLADKVYFELDLTQATAETSDDNDAEDCQLLPNNKTISEVASPELNQRLEAHLDWVRGKMSSWLTEEQKEAGLNSTFIFSALTAGWDKKRPLWLRWELGFNLSFIVGNIE